MGNRSFFNALHDREGDFLLATVLEGPAQGERVLLRNTAPVWPEKLPAFWGEHLPALAAVTSSGILKSAGQRIFVERFGAAPQLVVCGGGHVGASVVRLAKLLGLPVTALEDRPEFAEELRQAGADAVLCLPFAEGLAQIPGGQETYFVVVTRAHSCDIACLRSILQKPAAYVGMMGSRKRAALVHTQLAELGLPQERIDALHAPIGLSIGAKTAQEIALSILAEIVSVKNSRQQTEGFSPALLAALDAAGLTDRVDAIHLDDLSRLTMDYAGRFSVEMEYNADYDRMLQILEAGISKLESNQTGSIRLDLNPPILTLD